MGHLTEAVYRRYDIVEERMLNEAGVKLQNFYDCAGTAPPTVVPFNEVRAARGMRT